MKVKCVMCDTGRWPYEPWLMACPYCKGTQYFVKHRRKKKRKSQTWQAMKRSPLRKVSKAMEKRLREYRKLKKVTLSHYTFCEMPDCHRRAFQVHHTKGRSGDNLCNTATWMLLCSVCHDWIHSHPNEARKKGWLKF